MPSTNDEIGVPFRFRVINHVGRVLMRLGLARPDLDPEHLMAAAREETGLSDFGPDDGWREGLQRLVSSYERQGDLSFVGRHAMRIYLLRILVQRALVADELRRNPEIARVPIERPIFIVGLPRTGTTVLHNLLAQDEHARTPKLWELLRPSPAPEPDTPLDDPRIVRCIEDAERGHEVNPAVLRIHPFEPLDPDECLFIFGLACRPRFASAMAPCPDFMRWVMDHDMRAAYRYHRQILQLLSYRHRRRYWVLKAPTHLFDLDVLLQTYPDAVVIQTHRHPAAVAASICSLYQATRRIYSAYDDPSTLGAEWLETWGVALERALAVRQAHDEATFHDLRFEDYVPDPRAGTLALLDRLGIEPSAGTSERMQAWLDAHRRDRHGQHRYRLEDFGLTHDAVAERFAGYVERFGLSPEPPR